MPPDKFLRPYRGLRDLLAHYLSPADFAHLEPISTGSDAPPPGRLERTRAGVADKQSAGLGTLAEPFVRDRTDHYPALYREMNRSPSATFSPP